MGVPFELNWMIVTKDNESKISDENEFSLQKEGYRLYPLDIPIEVRRQKLGVTTGFAIIKSVSWTKGDTKIIYKMISLKTEA